MPKQVNSGTSGPKTLIVAETVGERASRVMVEIGKQEGFGILWLPAYSGCLSPLEHWFRRIAGHLKEERLGSDPERVELVSRVIAGKVRDYMLDF
jgi:hypothetical protein